MQLPYRDPPSVFVDFPEIQNLGIALRNVRCSLNPPGANRREKMFVVFAPGWKLGEVIKVFWTIPVTLRGLTPRIIVVQPARLQ
jgi:hypothetical protein